VIEKAKASEALNQFLGPRCAHQPVFAEPETYCLDRSSTGNSLELSLAWGTNVNVAVGALLRRLGGFYARWLVWP